MAIYFLTPDYAFASGGVRVIYRHVDILNTHGIEAYVLHRKRGFRCSWFSNQTPVVYWDSSLGRRAYFKIRKYLQPERTREIFLQDAQRSYVGPDDVLVLPEIYGPTLAEISPGVPKVILNQNSYLSFQGYPLDGKPISSPYAHSDVKGVLINSEDGLEYLRYVFPDLPVTRFHLAIDPITFSFRGKKTRQICYTPRKNELVVRQVINILKTRKALRGFKLTPFSGLPQDKVANLMQESALFLSFGQYEGFGLPPAEAMACGCVAIGYHAGGGREFMKPEFSFPVAYGEVIEYARTVESVIQQYDEDPDRFAALGKAASDFILDTYSTAREQADILEFWEGLLAAR